MRGVGRRHQTPCARLPARWPPREGSPKRGGNDPSRHLLCLAWSYGRPWRGGTGDVGPVENGDGHGVAERDEVADVHYGVDGRDVAALGEPTEQRLGGVEAPGRSGAKLAEDAAPRGDLGRSAIAVSSSLSEAARCSARYSSGSSGGLGPLESPVAWITPARIVGYRSVICVVVGKHVDGSPSRVLRG